MTLVGTVSKLFFTQLLVCLSLYTTEYNNTINNFEQTDQRVHRYRDLYDSCHQDYKDMQKSQKDIGETVGGSWEAAGRHIIFKWEQLATHLPLDVFR